MKLIKLRETTQRDIWVDSAKIESMDVEKQKTKAGPIEHTLLHMDSGALYLVWQTPEQIMEMALWKPE